jgi:hypothetical protein
MWIPIIEMRKKGLPSLAQISSEGLAEAEDSPISAID